MVLWTLGRMVARRLALRKGLAVSAALLLLLGWSLLYTSTKFGARRAEPRTVEMVNEYCTLHPLVSCFKGFSLRYHIPLPSVSRPSGPPRRSALFSMPTLLP